MTGEHSSVTQLRMGISGHGITNGNGMGRHGIDVERDGPGNDAPGQGLAWCGAPGRVPHVVHPVVPWGWRTVLCPGRSPGRRGIDVGRDAPDIARRVMPRIWVGVAYPGHS